MKRLTNIFTGGPYHILRNVSKHGTKRTKDGDFQFFLLPKPPELN